MNISRRTAVIFAGAGLSGTIFHRCRADDNLDAKLRKPGTVEGLFKADLPTPALLLDLDVFERNVARMAEHAGKHDKQMRPHAKTHKCVEIARRQCQAGAIGVCVATVPEAVVMSEGGIDGILLASPIASPSKADRMAVLGRDGRSIMVAVDHPQQVELYEQAAAKAGSKLGVLIDLDVGDHRTGIEPGEASLRLADKVMKSNHLVLRGLQAYSGGSSHIVGWSQRREHSQRALAAAAEARNRFRRLGLPAEILSGASTGTYNIDTELAELSELQAGSYVAMDVDYRRIGGSDGEVFNDFGPALTVLVTVVSANHARQATVDAGFKAFATDRPFGPETKDRKGITYGFKGDEFGILSWESGTPPPRLGDRLELLAPHCDPTVNLYDRIYACRGEQVEAIWSVMDRLPTVKEAKRS